MLEKLKAAFLIMDVSTLKRLILEVSFQSRIRLPPLSSLRVLSRVCDLLCLLY